MIANLVASSTPLTLNFVVPPGTRPAKPRLDHLDKPRQPGLAVRRSKPTHDAGPGFLWIQRPPVPLKRPGATVGPWIPTGSTTALTRTGSWALWLPVSSLWRGGAV